MKVSFFAMIAGTLAMLLSSCCTLSRVFTPNNLPPQCIGLEANFAAGQTLVNVGESIPFTDQSIGNVVSWNWTFSGGTPSVSTSQNPQVVYNQPGTYSVSLTVRDGLGNSQTETRSSYITVQERLRADFSATPRAISVGESVSYNDNSLGQPTAWNWTFEGGSPSTSTNEDPRVTYTTPGTYRVSLRVQNSANNFDTEVKERYITVSPRLNANFIASRTSITAGDQVTFQDQSSGNPSAWVWTFEGGNPSNSSSQNPRVTYSRAGRYQVRLQVRNAQNDTDTETKEAYIVVAKKRSERTISLSSVSKACPRKTRGDRDFDGNGPDVIAWAEIKKKNPTQLELTYFIEAKETKSDWTTARRTWTRVIDVDGNVSIVRILSDTRSEVSYRDRDHEVDVFPQGTEELVRSFSIRGDTGGDDVGNCTNDDTYLSITFNPVRILVEEN